VTSWDETQKEFRRAVLARGDKTLAEVAEEAHVGERTVVRLMSDVYRSSPRPAVRACVERFVDRQKAQPDSGDTKE